MPRNDDHSAGDARRPYADEGGPAGHHAQSHDVRKEQASNSTPTEPGEDFEADLHGDHSEGGRIDETIAASADKTLKGHVRDLDHADLAQLSVLAAGTRLDQGSTYVDLDALDQGPFTAMGGQEAEPEARLVAKRTTDHELWERLIGTQH